MTDEKVAKALGWVKKYGPKTGTRWDKIAWWERGEGNTYEYSADAPAFTTSLDAIVAEIEARGLKWFVGSHGVSPVNGEAIGWVAKHGTVPESHRAVTAPLALCAALLAFLKEKP